MIARALHLIRQSRYELAERELMMVLGNDPEDFFAHAYLGLCQSELDRPDEAERSIKQAIGLRPDEALGHFFLGMHFYKINKLKDARLAVDEAIRNDPEDSQHFMLLSNIYLRGERWEKALEAANKGLEIDPMHVDCKNSRAFALTKLGRQDEAHATIEGALEDDPEDSNTFANLGWTYMHQGEHKQAMEHFREALRLEPENEWARNGMVHALKSKYLVYRLLLKFYLWLSVLPPKARMGVLIGLYVAIRLLRAVARSYPDMMPLFIPVFVIYGLFIYLTWTGTQFFNTLLRFNKFGRCVLNDKERAESNWYAGLFVGAAASAVSGYIIDSPLLLFTGGFLLVMTLPVCHLFACSEKKLNRRGLLFCVGLAGLGCVGLLSFALGAESVASVFSVLFILLFIIFTWTGAIISTRRAEV